MNLLVLVFLLMVVATGHVATTLVGLKLRAEERLAYGTIIGTVIVSTVGFGFAWIGGVDKLTMLGSAAVSLVAMALLARLAAPAELAGLRSEFADTGRRLRLGWRERDNPWPLVVLTLLGAVVSIRILALAYGTTVDGGLEAGHLSVFGDWSAHMGYAASFAYADNFPPELPTAAGESFAYHFGVDWFSAMFVPLGLSVPASLQVSSAFLAIAFPAVMYSASLRLVKSRLAAGLAVLVFLASGGTAALFRFIFLDLIDEGLGVLGALPRAYAFDGFDRNWVDNAVTGFLYPQRPTMIGFTITLFGLAVLWQAREGADGDTTSGARASHRPHLFVGVLAGLMPIFHVFAFGVLVVIGFFWALLERTRRWLYFVVPTLLMGLPIVWWQIPERSGRDGWHTFWMLGLSSWERTFGDFLWFWLLNTGLFIPLAIWGFLSTDAEQRNRFLPIFGLLLIPNVAIWHFWPGNNVKYLAFFLLLAAPFVGERLATWLRRGPVFALGGALLVISLTLSGGLDVWRAFEGTTGAADGQAAWPVSYLSGSDVLVGEWVRDHTEPDAVLATANSNVHPVRALAGRTVVAGSDGRLNDLGVEWVPRVDALRTVYGVFEGFDAVIAEYEIDYLVLGPMERQAFRPAGAPDDWDPAQFWDAAAPIVYDVGGYKIYDVRSYQ